MMKDIINWLKAHDDHLKYHKQHLEAHDDHLKIHRKSFSMHFIMILFCFLLSMVSLAVAVTDCSGKAKPTEEKY